MRTFPVFPVVALFLSAPSHAFGQAAHDTVRETLVHIVAKGASAGGGEGGTTKTSEGTGFLVSSDGLILTSDDVLERLEKQGVEPGSVLFSAAIEEKSADKRPALLMERSEALDLLLLKIPPGADAYTPVTLGSAFEHGDDEEVLASGFAENVFTPRKKSADGISSREGSKAHFYEVGGLDADDGMGGSPVYDEDALIIGIVKIEGTDGSDSIIPIDYADALLAQIRLRELRENLKRVLEVIEHERHGPEVLDQRLSGIESNLEHLRQQFTWSIEHSSLRYRKLVAGDPHIKMAEVMIALMDPTYAPNSPMTGLPIPPTPPVARQFVQHRVPIGDVGGEFDLKPFFDNLQAQIENNKISNVPSLYVEIVPFLENNVRLDVVRLIRRVDEDRFNYP